MLKPRVWSEAYIVQKIREQKDEEPTIYSRACGFVETVDDYIGLGCLDRRKKALGCVGFWFHELFKLKISSMSKVGISSFMQVPVQAVLACM